MPLKTRHTATKVGQLVVVQGTAGDGEWPRLRVSGRRGGGSGLAIAASFMVLLRALLFELFPKVGPPSIMARLIMGPPMPALDVATTSVVRL